MVSKKLPHPEVVAHLVTEAFTQTMLMLQADQQHLLAELGYTQQQRLSLCGELAASLLSSGLVGMSTRELARYHIQVEDLYHLLWSWFTHQPRLQTEQILFHRFMSYPEYRHHHVITQNRVSTVSPPGGSVGGRASQPRTRRDLRRTLRCDTRALPALSTRVDNSHSPANTPRVAPLAWHTDHAPQVMPLPSFFFYDIVETPV